MTGADLDKLILVGGPTHSPVLREMLRNQITTNVDTSIDPMTAVASGAALYASTLDNMVKEKVDFGTVAIKLDYEATTVEDVEYVNINLDASMCEGTIPGNLTAEIVRSDKGWSSGKFPLTEQIDVIECYLVEGKSNSFDVVVYDESGNVLKCSPNNFTIIQGAKVGSAILPYNIGIEVWDDVRDKAVFKAIKGLEKNKPLPAVGVINGLKTTGEIRPAMDADFIKIPLYQAEYDGEGLPAACFEYVYEVKLTGANVPALLPEGSDVDLTIRVDRSEQISLEVFIPSQSHSEDIFVPRDSVQTIQTNDYVQSEINKAAEQIRKLRRDGCDVAALEEGLERVQAELNNGDEIPQVMKHLKDCLQNIAKADSVGEWERMEKRLLGALKMLEDDNKKYGDSETTAQIEAVRRQVHLAISKKDYIAAKELLEVMHSLNFKLATLEYYMVWVADWDRRFNIIDWEDRSEARSLIDRAKTIMINNPSVNALSPIIDNLIDLLPAKEKPTGPNGLLR
jgi:molecular chaperone DnaK